MVGFVSDSVVARRRRTAESRFKQLGMVRREQRERLADATTDIVWRDAGELRGTLRTVRAGLQTEAEAIVTTYRLQWLCAVGSDLRHTDQLVIGDGEYRITSIEQDRTNATFLIADVVRVDGRPSS